VNLRALHAARPSASAIVWGPYVLLVVVHAALGLGMRQPHIFPDELAYLGHARFLSGAGNMPDMAATDYYHFGYSVLLVPAFLLSPENPPQTYRAVIMTNAVVMSTLFIALQYTLQHGFQVGRQTAVIASFVTSLYPAFVLQSNFAWAENGLIPGYAWLLAAFTGFLRRQSPTRGALLGLSAGLLYAVHPRTLPIVGMAAVIVAGLTSGRMAARSAALAAFAVGAATIAGVVAVNEVLRGVGWSSDGHATSAAGFLARVARPTRLPGAAMAAAGQMLYLIQATFGLLLLPAVWLIEWLRRAEWQRLTQADRCPGLISGFALLTSAALFATSALSMSSGGMRADHLVYGRYNEMFLAPYLATAFVLLIDQPARLRWRSHGLAILTISALLTAVVVGLRGPELLSRDYVAPNIFGIYPIVRALGRVHLLITFIVSAMAFLVSFFAFRRSAAAGSVVVSVVWLAGGVYGYQYCRDAQQSIASRDEIPSRVRDLGPVDSIAYDIAQAVTQRMDLGTQVAARYFSSQYLLPRTRLVRFNGDGGEYPAAPIVISRRRWPAAERFRARFVTSERRTEMALWVLPESEHYISASQSYLDVALGWRWFPGVFERGFHAEERDERGPFRWTNGHATLVIPMKELPTHLHLDLTAALPDQPVKIVVNGTPLLTRPYSGGVRTFSLPDGLADEWITIELVSATITPSKTNPGSADNRALGVVVREIRLVRR
jgi:hypothetical protein